MKHIKSYKLYENVDDIESTLKEICLELIDIGYQIVIGENPITGVYNLQIHNSSFWLFDFDEVSEIIERVKDYLGDKYLSTYTSNNNNIEKLYKNGDYIGPVSAVRISFTID